VVLGFELRGVELSGRNLRHDGLDDGSILEEIRAHGARAARGHMVFSMAGPLAERTLQESLGIAAEGFDAVDLRDVRHIAVLATCEGIWEKDEQGAERGTISPEEQERKRPQIEALMKSAFAESSALVQKYLEPIRRVAEVLITKGEILGPEVKRIIESFEVG
jgi:hypothetical protein